MIYVWAPLLILLNLAWLATVVVGLPGTWLMVISTALFAWWHCGDPTTGQAGMFSVATLIVITGLAGLGELTEFLTGAVGSKRVGGTRWGSVGALVGGVIGGIAATPLLPLIGSLVGASAGACLGALLLELLSGQRWRTSWKVGLGAGTGTFLGRLAKLVAGVLIWLIVAVAAFWP